MARRYLRKCPCGRSLMTWEIGDSRCDDCYRAALAILGRVKFVPLGGQLHAAFHHGVFAGVVVHVPGGGTSGFDALVISLSPWFVNTAEALSTTTKGDRRAREEEPVRRGAEAR